MAEKTVFDVGIVGAGGISRFHLEALRRVPNAHVVGIADVDQHRAQQAAKQAVAASFPSLEALISAGAKVIHVLTPPATHCQVALAALESGCHVYVEKPLATSLEDCERIAAAAKMHHRSVCVGHSLMRDPFVVRGLSLVKAGVIGDPLTVDYFRCQPAPPYAGGPLPEYYRHGGHPFRDLGIHALYLIEAFLGQIQDAKAAVRSTAREPHLFADEWRVLLDCERGTGQIQLSWNVRPQQNLLVVQGTQGVIRIDLFGMSVALKSAGRLPEHAARVLNALSESHQIATQVVGNTVGFLTRRVRRFHGLQTLVAEFYDALAEGGPAPISPESAYSAVDWTERIARRADEAKVRRDSRHLRPLAAKTLVTGASGFVGRHLVQRLLGEGTRVRLLVRREPPDDWLRDDRIEVVLGDLGDPQAVERAIAGVDTIYHVGAAMRGAAHDFERGTVLGTRHVVDNALDQGVARFIYISSLSVLHSLARRPGQKIAEDWPQEPFPDSRGHYTRSKCAAEQYVSRAVCNQGLPAVILRPGEIVGRGAPLITSGIAQRRGKQLIVLGNGRLRVPMVYIDDLIDAIRLAVNQNRWNGPIFHVIDPLSPTQNEVIARFVAASAEPLRVRYVPRPVVYGLAVAVQAVAASLRRNAPLSLYRVRSALAERSFDDKGCAERLQWVPRVGIEEGLRRALECAPSEQRVSGGCILSTDAFGDAFDERREAVFHSKTPA